MTPLATPRELDPDLRTQGFTRRVALKGHATTNNSFDAALAIRFVPTWWSTIDAPCIAELMLHGTLHHGLVVSSELFNAISCHP